MRTGGIRDISRNGQFWTNFLASQFPIALNSPRRAEKSLTFKNWESVRCRIMLENLEESGQRSRSFYVAVVSPPIEMGIPTVKSLQSKKRFSGVFCVCQCFSLQRILVDNSEFVRR